MSGSFSLKTNLHVMTFRSFGRSTSVQVPLSLRELISSIIALRHLSASGRERASSTDLGPIEMLNLSAELEVIAFDRAFSCRLKYASVLALSIAFCDGLCVHIGRSTGAGAVLESESASECAELACRCAVGCSALGGSVSRGSALRGEFL